MITPDLFLVLPSPENAPPPDAQRADAVLDPARCGLERIEAPAPNLFVLPSPSVIALQADCGLEVFRRRVLPVEREDSASDNILVVDFRASAEAKIIRFPWVGPLHARGACKGGPASLDGSEEDAPSHLPGEEGATEVIAHFSLSDSRGEGLPEKFKGVAKAMAHGELPRMDGPGDEAVQAAGITVARQDRRMDSMKNSEPGNDLAGRGRDDSQEFPPFVSESGVAELRGAEVSCRIADAMDWPAGRPIGSLDRPSPVVPAPRSAELSATVERIAGLIARETSLVRQYSSDSMAVVLRPDDSTELYVHFARRHGLIEATIRCDRGDARQLGALWPQLQDSLAHQRVRLAPLQEGPAADSDSNHPTGFGASGQGGGSQRHASPDQQSMDERSAPASSPSELLHGRRRGGSRRRLTTSRPGWETWA